MSETEAFGEIVAWFAANLPGALLGSTVARGELTLETAPADIVRVLTALRDEAGFALLIDVCGADWPAREKRFDVVYHLLSLADNVRVRVKLRAGEGEKVPSATGVFPAAGWYERETFDMYGVAFDGSPDMRRILTDYGFEGHPLRKDFPLTGFVEVRYDDDEKKVAGRPVELAQEYRDFDFESPWEGPAKEKGE
jgi:NADH-quinone oxidoreductase subunit C